MAQNQRREFGNDGKYQPRQSHIHNQNVDFRQPLQPKPNPMHRQQLDSYGNFEDDFRMSDYSQQQRNSLQQSEHRMQSRPMNGISFESRMSNNANFTERPSRGSAPQYFNANHEQMSQYAVNRIKREQQNDIRFNQFAAATVPLNQQYLSQPTPFRQPQQSYNFGFDRNAIHPQQRRAQSTSLQNNSFNSQQFSCDEAIHVLQQLKQATDPQEIAYLTDKYHKLNSLMRGASPTPSTSTVNTLKEESPSLRQNRVATPPPQHYRKNSKDSPKAKDKSTKGKHMDFASEKHEAWSRKAVEDGEILIIYEEKQECLGLIHGICSHRHTKTIEHDGQIIKYTFHPHWVCIKHRKSGQFKSFANPSRHVKSHKQYFAKMQLIYIHICLCA